MDPEVTDASTTDASSTSAPQSQETAAPAAETSDKGYVDAVLSALKPQEGSQPSEPDQKQAVPAAKPEGDQPKATEADDPTEDELKNYNPGARKRISQLLGQRRELREQTEAFQREVEPLKAQAKVAQDLQSFVQANGLTKEDLDLGFSVMGMMQSQPAKALEMLMPIVQQLQQKVGNVLPDDLVADVQAGKVTVERALELSRMRAANSHMQESSKRQSEAEQERSRAEAHQQNVVASSTAVSDWERTKSVNDPDWHLKSERIAQLVELEVRRMGAFPDAKTAVTLHQKALDQVNTELKKFRPAPKPMRMATGHASPNSVTEPKSYLEAALAGLQQARSQ